MKGCGLDASQTR